MDKRSIRIGLAALTIAGIAVVYSCKKTKDTIATVLVTTQDGTPVPNATVRLYSKSSLNPAPPSTPRFDTLGTTNGAGKVTFDFSPFYKRGQAGFAVLDIMVCKGTLVGSGIIKIQEETTNEEAIKVANGDCLIPEQ
jgi:hypothetical protein